MSRSLDELPADSYEYVVVDEFHHAAAPSYERLLDRVRPRVLLGLTATPERSDGLDVLRGTNKMSLGMANVNRSSRKLT
jgi:superfamily II DNA or RNA helicase